MYIYCRGQLKHWGRLCRLEVFKRIRVRSAHIRVLVWWAPFLRPRTPRKGVGVWGKAPRARSVVSRLLACGLYAERSEAGRVREANERRNFGKVCVGRDYPPERVSVRLSYRVAVFDTRGRFW